MFTKSKYNRRIESFFYALVITVGIYISVTELHYFQNTYNFIVFSFATLFVYIIELFTSFQNKSRKIQINFNFNDEVNEISLLFHKIILPILLYLSILGFTYFNIRNASVSVILLLTFFSFYTLILNTKLFLEYQIKEENKTHYVYDVIKFLIFFLMVDTFANLYRSIGENAIVFSIAVFIVAFVINYLMLIRIYKVNFKNTFISGTSSFLISFIFGILIIFSALNPLQISLLLIFLFYISTAIIHHAISKSLTREVFLEYILVSMLLLVIVFLGS